MTDKDEITGDAPLEERLEDLPEEKMQGDWHLRQEIDGLKINLANSKSRVKVLEAEIQRLQATAREVDSAWHERGKMRDDFMATQELLRMSLKLLAYFAEKSER